MNRIGTDPEPPRTKTTHKPFKIRFRFGSYEPEPPNRRFRPGLGSGLPTQPVTNQPAFPHLPTATLPPATSPFQPSLPSPLNPFNPQHSTFFYKSPRRRERKGWKFFLSNLRKEKERKEAAVIWRRKQSKRLPRKKGEGKERKEKRERRALCLDNPWMIV